MTQAKSRRRFHVNNYYKSCGNCGLWLYEGDDITKVEGNVGILDSPYFHTDYQGCVDAMDKMNTKIKFRHAGKAVTYG